MARNYHRFERVKTQRNYSLNENNNQGPFTFSQQKKPFFNPLISYNDKRVTNVSAQFEKISRPKARTRW